MDHAVCVFKKPPVGYEACGVYFRGQLTLAQSTPTILNDCTAINPSEGVHHQLSERSGIFVKDTAEADDHRFISCCDELTQAGIRFPFLFVEKQKSHHMMVHGPIGTWAQDMTAYSIQCKLC